jgi:putative transposase
VVPTITFHLLFVFVVLRHHRRELLHVDVTDQPSAVWTARQVIEAFPEEAGPTFLLRDRDSIYGEAFTRRVDHMGIRQVITAPSAPWQNPFVERVIGSIRRECLDHCVPRMPNREGGNAAEEMRAGPSESGCRTRLQTPSRCVGQEPAW